MISSPKSVLESVDLFSQIDTSVLEVVASMSRFIHMADGTAIFRVGDESRRLYIVDSGEIVIQKVDDAGNRTDIARFLAGDIFGELDLFTGERRSADAMTAGPTRLLEFPQGDLTLAAVSDQRPDVGARLLHAFLARISSRIRGVNAMVKENSPLVRELKRQVYVDKLTGLFNRTFFEEILEKTLMEFPMTGLLMYKPDNFKAINDGYGHETGDKALKLIAASLREFVPDRDMLFRYMGNENAVVLPKTDRNQLREFAGQMGAFLRNLDLSSLIPDKNFRLSVSFGLALAPEHGINALSLINAAHSLTLKGRRLGGNRDLFPEDSGES